MQKFLIRSLSIVFVFSYPLFTQTMISQRSFLRIFVAAYFITVLCKERNPVSFLFRTV